MSKKYRLIITASTDQEAPGLPLIEAGIKDWLKTILTSDKYGLLKNGPDPPTSDGQDQEFGV